MIKGKPVYTGYLLHRGYFFKLWNRKYVVLYSNKKLKYYSDESVKNPIRTKKRDLVHSDLKKKCKKK